MVETGLPPGNLSGLSAMVVLPRQERKHFDRIAMSPTLEEGHLHLWTRICLQAVEVPVHAAVHQVMFVAGLEARSFVLGIICLLKEPVGKVERDPRHEDGHLEERSLGEMIGRGPLHAESCAQGHLPEHRSQWQTSP